MQNQKSITEEKTLICTKCSAPKSSPRCKTCAANYIQLWKIKNRKHVNAYQLAWKAKDPENNKKAVGYIRKWQKLNPKKVASHNAKWVKSNPKYYSLYIKKRSAASPDFKLRCTIRNKISAALKNKENGVLDLLGCNITKARKHLEAQFRPGMSWQTHSKFGWHVDHIKPISSFDLTDETQRKQCFHYTNLQPLWWWENLKKGSKIIP